MISPSSVGRGRTAAERAVGRVMAPAAAAEEGAQWLRRLANGRGRAEREGGLGVAPAAADQAAARLFIHMVDVSDRRAALATWRCGLARSSGGRSIRSVSGRLRRRRSKERGAGGHQETATTRSVSGWLRGRRGRASRSGNNVVSRRIAPDPDSREQTGDERRGWGNRRAVDPLGRTRSRSGSKEKAAAGQMLAGGRAVVAELSPLSPSASGRPPADHTRISADDAAGRPARRGRGCRRSPARGCTGPAPRRGPRPRRRGSSRCRGRTRGCRHRAAECRR